MDSWPPSRSGLHRPVRLLVLVSLATLIPLASCTPVYGPWTRTSERPVEPLDHPALAAAVAGLQPGLEQGFSFAVYGDQRALADGEWQRLLAGLAERAAHDRRLLFLVDTGDMVRNGEYSDQFAELHGILQPVAGLPYLAAAGNHDVNNNLPGRARENTAVLLSSLDPDLSVDRLYYRQDIGPLCLLFLDSNDWVYGPDGRGESAGGLVPRSRAAAQLAWLTRQLKETDGVPITAVVMHHPFLQSAPKHRDDAIRLWQMTWEGRRFVDLLLDGGVDLVFCGDTHTHERFLLTRLADGRRLRLINLSGRPRPSFLWFGAGARRARDIAGHEDEQLTKDGWTHLAEYRIVQEEAMTGTQADQSGIFSVEPDSSLSLQMLWLDDEAPRGLRFDLPIHLD